ncbi:MAG: hypothetical protein IJH48_07390 [Oscillospiraceae bacterium]|nr:hypothetical protein [Oscillospiraceae bacterium]
MAERYEKSSGWGLFLLFWTMLLMMLGFLACVVFYKYAGVYEETRPERTMDALMEQMSEEDWREALAATAGGVSEYEDARSLFDDYFDSTVKGRTLSYRRDLSRSDETQSVFVLYAGPARIGEVRLLPHETGERFSFGRSVWELDSIVSKPLSDSLQAVTVRIDAPDGVTPFLNGAAVGLEKVVDPAVPLTELSELERRFDAAPPRMVRYEIGPLYGQIAVSDPDGNEIAPVGEPEDGVVRYVIMPTKTWSLRVEAPEGVTVSVRGAELGEEQVRSREQNIFRGLEDYLPQGGYDTLLYAVDGLYIEPQISASYNGAALTPVIGEDGRTIYFYPTDADISIAMHEAAEGFFRAYMYYSSYKYNGAALKDLTDRILPDTELYSYFAQSYDAMIWASATEMNQRELRVDNFHRVGDSCFTCTILYKADFTATSWYEQYSYAREDGYKMVFIRSDGQWLAATMSAFE